MIRVIVGNLVQRHYAWILLVKQVLGSKSYTQMRGRRGIPDELTACAQLITEGNISTISTSEFLSYNVVKPDIYTNTSEQIKYT